MERPGRKFFFAALVLIFILLFVRYVDRVQKREGADFRVYHTAARAFAEKKDLYAKFEDPSIAVYKYSPFFAMMAAPAALLSLYQAALVFFVINFVFILLIFFYSGKLITGEDEPERDNALLYVLPLLFTGRFFLGVLDAGQVNIVMIGFCVFGLYAMRRGNEALAAAFFVTAALVKYTPFIFIPYFFFRGHWKLVLWSAFFAALFCFLPMAYVGAEKGWSYLNDWLPYAAKTSLDIGSLADFRNQSLVAAVLRYFSSGQYFVDRIELTHLTVREGLVLSAAAGAVLYLLMLWPARRGVPARFAESLDTSLLFIGVALFNANAWAFNYLALFFAYMTLTAYLARQGFTDKITLSLMLGAAVLSLGGRGLVGKNLREWSDILSLVTIGALLLAAALLRLKFVRRVS